MSENYKRSLKFTGVAIINIPFLAMGSLPNLIIFTVFMTLSGLSLLDKLK